MLIKQITGNLDNNDLEHLENKLEYNSILIKEKLTLTSNILNSFTLALRNVTSNIEHISNQLYNQTYINTKELIFVELVFQAETLHDLFQQITEGITFAQNKMFHPSIIDPYTLKKIIDKIPNEQRIKGRLSQLYPILKTQVLLDPITFIITIPTVIPEQFQLIQINPIIHPYQDTCIYPISQTKQILKGSILKQVTHCTFIQEFICEESADIPTNCEKNIINNLENVCKYTKVQCPTKHVMKLTDNVVYIYAKKIDMTKHCNKETWKQELSGSILLNLDDCTYTIDQQSYTRTTLDVQELSAPEMQINERDMTRNPPIIYKPETKGLQEQIELLKHIPTNQQLSHGTWGLSLSTTLIIIILIIFLYLYMKKTKPQAKPNILLQPANTFGVPASD